MLLSCRRGLKLDIEFRPQSLTVVKLVCSLFVLNSVFWKVSMFFLISQANQSKILNARIWWQTENIYGFWNLNLIKQSFNCKENSESWPDHSGAIVGQNLCLPPMSSSFIYWYVQTYRLMGSVNTRGVTSVVPAFKKVTLFSWRLEYRIGQRVMMMKQPFPCPNSYWIFSYRSDMLPGNCE